VSVFITIYIVFGWAMVVVGLLIIVQGSANGHFFRKRIRQVRPPHNYTPSVDLICPCCGLDPRLDDNLRRILVQNYPDYKVIFVVADSADPAVPVIQKLIDEFGTDRACLVVAGKATTCAQKVHNQLAAIRQGSRNAEVLAFIDSDIYPEPNLLRHLVDPLVRPRIGVVTGYRWYVPTRHNLATVTLSYLNAIPAGSMGQHRLNHAWGGTMATRREYFDRLKIADIWSVAITDDLTLSTAARKARLKVIFEPKCFSASCDSFTWPQLFEFSRRQLMITRTCAPGIWLMVLGASLQYALAFWIGIPLSIWAWHTGHPALHLIWPIPVIIYVYAAVKGLLRLVNICPALPDHVRGIKLAAWMDILASPFANVVMLICIIASALTNTITWRGITYRLHRSDKTEILSN
jgi:cellulose synthase/poly-beta-1,6-N-acetylglucosamine synthase-like glycosyltransferase